ncbi:MAG TPA: YihY/virulence factor BrkB family protein [Blastocatellia bacterium]|nr:YihY/virulence factor BrkB family protein [Blastocatellia bacterium]
MREKPILGGLTLKQLARRTLREANEDNVLGRAAELAYFFLLALFPLLIFLLSLISFFPSVQELIFLWLSRLMPPDAKGLIDAWIETVFSTRSGGLLSLGILSALLAASSGIVALMQALNTAYEVKEGRSFWKARLVALGLTIAVCLLVIGGALIITYGDQLARLVAGWLGIGIAFEAVWPYVNYLLGLFMLTVGLSVLYYFAPNARQRWKLVTPGAIFAVVAIVLVSYLFSLYLRFAPSYNVTYGSLGAVVVLMLWLYLMGLIVLLGGEINAEIDRALGKHRVEREQPEA